MRQLLNKLLLSFTSSLGIVVYRSKPGQRYVVCEPGFHLVPGFIGRSANKLNDIRKIPIFEDSANRVIKDKRTYLHYDRLYTIFGALKNICRLHKDEATTLNIAEVGVFRGGCTHFLADTSERLGQDVNIYSFDTFEGHDSRDISTCKDNSTVHVSGHFGDVAYSDVQEYLQAFSNVQLHKGRFEDRCSAIDTLKFSLVHLDVDIYAPTVHALAFFAERLLPGGIIIVDDYGFSTCPGIPSAIVEFTSVRNDFVSVPQLSGQCVLIKV